MTGRPRSIASSATIPNPSPNEGTTTTCARSSTGATGDTRPENVTTSSSPSRRTAARSSPSSAEEHLVALDRNQPSDDREARRPGQRRRRRGGLDAVVDDLEAFLVEPLALGEVPREPGGDRDVHIRERGHGTVGSCERAPVAERVEAVLRAHEHRHRGQPPRHETVEVGMDEVRVEDRRAPATDEPAKP
jgi:hypothetical protein